MIPSSRGGRARERSAADRGLAANRHQWRKSKDTLARYGVAAGGLSVIAALLLIFLYLIYMVLPLFRGATVDIGTRYPVPGPVGDLTLDLAMEEYATLGVRFTESGRAIFFRLDNGAITEERDLPVANGASVSSFGHGTVPSALIALGLSNGRAVVARHTYEANYPQSESDVEVPDYEALREITPHIDFPLGETPIRVDENEQPLRLVAIQGDQQQTTLAAYTTDRRLLLSRINVSRSLLGGISLEQENAALPDPGAEPVGLALNERQDRLFLACADGYIAHYELSPRAPPRLLERVPVTHKDERITSMAFLVGSVSLIVGTSQGSLSQWFPVRDQDNRYHLTHIRDFEPLPGAIRDIAPDYRRKGFLAADASGYIGVYHATAHRTLTIKQVTSSAVVALAQSPRANALLLQDNAGQMHFGTVHNEHPEVSWSALWGKVWYEGRSEPEYVWQSSAASNDFEPKYSLTPLSFGTLKAALYAMALAVPLAVFGALYTAYFMAPAMRKVVKPSIELMEALPTVILGFLAGLWLAPFVDRHLPGVFALLVVGAPGLLLAAYLWQNLPAYIRHRMPDGWEAALLIPAVLLLGTLSLWVSPTLEVWLFHGDMPRWITNELGIDYDQRNALIIGLAMGFAVIPSIFSIAEDAIFTVPRHLTTGSLALGATPWQTLSRVVLLTASPGIFSAVMIGLGRAVGETMIVLMATGNTPVTDWNIFEGMRTLSANIAVELPETEVASTHYRILFLAGLVLFVFTFLFNTAAEIIRQRLRKRYATL